ncbi:MAG: M81 family metallopeptidase [Chloroflexi bacterium]|nr:M81 family metallopeptidase [Chloroflexota bacterium]
MTKKLRIATLGIHHETNTFASNKTTMGDFKRSGLQTYAVQRGQQYYDMHAQSQTSMAGFIQASKRLDFELVPLLFAATDPAGIIDKEVFDTLGGEALDMLRDQGPFDGVLLNQMGAAVSEEYPDMDGELARRVREIVGSGVPVAMTLDLHANVSQQMAIETDALVIYKTNPHTDAAQRAHDACDLVVRMATENWRPAKWLEQPPMVVGIFQHDTRDMPMKAVIDDLETVLKQPGIVGGSIGEGYPWSDVYENGLVCYVLHEDSLDEAKKAARWIADRAWANRKELYEPIGPIPSQAVEYALRKAANKAVDAGPIVLLDVGDNIGAGSSGDSTFLLAEAIKQGASSWLQTIRDTEAIGACLIAGVGATITVKVGGKTDSLHGEPVELTGRITRMSDGRFEDTGTVHAGWRFFDGGTTVVIESQEGPTVALVTSRVGNMSREQFYSLGYRPEDFDIVVAKGVVSPRPAYQPIASELVTVNSPGATSADMANFEYKHVRKSLYPLDIDAKYTHDSSD